MTTIHLVDASPYVFRAWFSLPASMVDRDGRPANAVYGFVAFLLKLIEEEPVTHLAVAFDGSLTTSFRNEIDPAYKADRELPDPDFEAQFAACREFVEILGVPAWISDRFEADDLLASAVRGLHGDGRRLVVVSNDKDLTQLVGNGVEFLDAARGRRLDREGVRQLLGVEPEQVASLLALAGDPVDGIPGVRGIGRKSAAALLENFPDLDAIYRDLDAVTSLPLRGAASLADKLRRGEEDARRSMSLVRLVDDLALENDPDHMQLRGAFRGRLDQLMDRLGFEGLRARVPLRSAETG